jgi:hypothetical protein
VTAGRTIRLSGITVVVLFGGGSALWGLGMPNAGAPTSRILDFYDERYTRIIIGAWLSLLGIAAFVVFAAAVRAVLLDGRRADVLPTAAFGGAVLGMAAGLGAESINLAAALLARSEELGRSLGQALFEVSQILGSTASGIGLGVFCLATAAAALRGAEVLARWTSFLLLVVGAVLLTPVSHINEVAGAALVLVSAVVPLGLRTE